MPIWRGAPSAYVTSDGSTKIDCSLFSLLNQPLAPAVMSRPARHVLGDPKYTHTDCLDLVGGS